MDVLQEILKEHEEFRDLMKKIENAKDEDKRDLAAELRISVYGHHEAEEHVVFSKVEEDKDAEDVVFEMEEEHTLLNHQLDQLLEMRVDHSHWDARFGVLKEILTHHLDEEEEDFFPEARRVLSKEELEAAYEPFEAKHEEARKEAERTQPTTR